jgi:DNA replication protein DnaC
MSSQPRKLDSIGSIPVLKRVAEKLKAGYVPDPAYSPPEPDCPNCGDTRWIGESLDPGRPGFGVARSCRDCAPPRKRIAPEGMTFEAFNAYGDAKLTAALRVAQAFAESDWPVWVTFLGPNGSGKTHLAYAMLQARQERGNRVVAVRSSEIIRTIFATMQEDSVETEQNRVDYYARAPVLLVDELGRESQTPASKARTSEILNERYIDRLPTIITSNWTMEQIESVWPDVASRMRDAELGAIANMFGVEDYRQWK